jgi:hypothetical protein
LHTIYLQAQESCLKKWIAAQLVKKFTHRESRRIVIGKGPARQDVFTTKKYTKCFSGESCVVVELNPTLWRGFTQTCSYSILRVNVGGDNMSLRAET